MLPARAILEKSIPPCLLLSCCTGHWTRLVEGVWPRQTAWWVTPIAKLSVAAIQVAAFAQPVSGGARGPIAYPAVSHVVVVALLAKPVAQVEPELLQEWTTLGAGRNSAMQVVH